MSAVLISRELLTATRIAGAFASKGHELHRLDRPSELNGVDGVSLVLVDWDQREPGWSEELTAWAAAHQDAEPRVILFGPHADLEAHLAARTSGFGPMWARSKLFAEIGRLAGMPDPTGRIRRGR